MIIKKGQKRNIRKEKQTKDQETETTKSYLSLAREVRSTEYYAS